MPYFWLYVLPLGFLLTMYTITGYDASAHVSEETHGADQSAPKGHLAVGVLLGDHRLDRAAGHHLRDPEVDEAEIYNAGLPALTIFETALTSTAAKAVILISTVGQLFCGMACVTSASRMTFAFSRDGAVPGHNLWRRLGQNRTPTWSVLFVCVVALIVTIPAYFPNTTGITGGLPGRDVDLGHRAVHRLHHPGVPALADGRGFKAGPWTLGAKYRWVNAIAFVWVAHLRGHLLRCRSPPKVCRGKRRSAGHTSTTRRS